MLFFSMGMFILDDIKFPTMTYDNVIGGAGTFAALGAGMLLDKADRRSVGFILDEGADFPKPTLSTIRSWQMGVIERHSSERQTTRGLNVFGANEQRHFKYLTPKLRIEASDMHGSPAHAACIHLICSPLRCIEIVNSLTLTANQIIVWEPVPTDCNVLMWPEFKIASRLVAVVSPNALEAASLVDQPEPMTREAVETLVEKHYHDIPNLLIIRCGALGAYARGLGWYDAYHTDPTKVVDPSGAGNSFMGGLGLGLAKFKHDKHMAMVYASVAAGLVIEQVGPPKYDSATDTWNGSHVRERVVSYIKQREKQQGHHRVPS